MQFYFIRHGQSSNNALWESTGSSTGRSYDPKLTDAGRQQAALVAQFLCRRPSGAPARGRDPQNAMGFGITHVYCSLMVRAVATGHAIAEALNLPLHSWEDLHEEGGLYLDDEQTGDPIGQAGHNRAYFQTHYPRMIVPESLQETGWWNRPFEDVDQRPERVRRFLCELLERHGDTEDHVAMVSHGGFYNLFMAALLGLSQTERLWFTLNNAAITRIDFTDREAKYNPENRAEWTLCYSDRFAQTRCKTFTYVLNVAYMNRVDFLPRELIT